MTTLQAQTWGGVFGEAYTKRNSRSVSELDSIYIDTIGVTRTELNDRFLGQMDRDTKILEVGCNIGNQLLMLHEMGFTNLSGIDVQEFALDQARENCPEATFYQGSALELPFEDGEFDMVFTSGVLIHISPVDLPKALSEIVRCAKSQVWGYEFHHDEMIEIEYRDLEQHHWKGDYVAQYMAVAPDLTLDKNELLPWVTNNNVDVMFSLLK